MKKDKVCVLLYHKNAMVIFKKEWIEKCIKSIKQQTFQHFDVLELNYGCTDNQLYENSIFEHKILLNHVEAMNYLIDIAKDYYDYIFNVNIDDYYTFDRIEKQLFYLENSSYDMVASDFIIFTEKKEQEIEIEKKQVSRYNNQLKQYLDENYNIIPHPVVAWKSSFFTNLRYKNEIPEEDMRLWQRALEQNKTIFIIPHTLFYYRIHNNQITQLNKQNNIKIQEECLMNFINIFEKTEKLFLTWTDITRIFQSWWKHFHPEKKIPTDYDVRRTIDKTIGDPIPRKGWFIKIQKECEW